ncbi:MAG TPA: glycosyltransferase 87 family protein [Verrucomicrobiales bacterium]|nr:glycosyltransferase 87 family protein [Verrucomicrobiales bacterium]
MPARAWQLTLIGIVSLFAISGVFKDIRHTAEGGSIDLRNRVTGARLAAEGVDPYFYKWKPDDSERFCDPYNASQYPVSRTTVTPLVLALHAPVAGLPYRTQQWLWLVLQYVLLLASFAAWVRNRSEPDRLWGLLFLVTLCAAPFWRLHVDRGQIYVLYAAVFLILATCPAPAGRKFQAAPAFGAALLAALRPVYLICCAVPLLRSPRQAPTALAAGAGVMAGAGVAAAIPMLLWGPAIWTSYAQAMHKHAQLYLERFQDRAPATAFPAEIEGIALDTLAHFARIPFADVSIYRLASFALSPGWLLGLWALLLVPALALRASKLSKTALWWSVSSWAVLGDFILPAFRNTYNDVLIFPMLLLGLASLRAPLRGLWISVSSVFLAAHLSIGWLPKACFPAPSLIGMILALAAAGATTFLPPKFFTARNEG